MFCQVSEDVRLLLQRTRNQLHEWQKFYTDVVGTVSSLQNVSGPGVVTDAQALPLTLSKSLRHKHMLRQAPRSTRTRRDLKDDPSSSKDADLQVVSLDLFNLDSGVEVSQLVSTMVDCKHNIVTDTDLVMFTPSDSERRLPVSGDIAHQAKVEEETQRRERPSHSRCRARP